MGPNTKILCKGHLATSVDVGIGKIQTPVRREGDCCYLLHIGRNAMDTVDPLVCGHSWPFLVQLNSHRMFHDDILAANGVRCIVAPVKDDWNRHSSIGLDWQKNKDQ